MNQDKGISIFLTSHDLDDIDEICDDALVLSGGKLIYNGTLENLKHKYVKDKMVKVVGHSKMQISDLLPGARISREGRTTKIVYTAQRYLSEQILNAVSQAFEIEDITIQEPDINEIVSRIFSNEEMIL